MGTSELKQRADTLADKVLDLAKNHPMSWAIILGWTTGAFVLGAWIF